MHTNHAIADSGTPLTAASYLAIYNLGDTLEELFQAPYNRTLPPLLDDLHPSNQIDAAMPVDAFAILPPD